MRSMTPSDLCDEREAFEDALQSFMPAGVTFSLKWKKGRYIADFAQLHWLMWLKARNLA